MKTKKKFIASILLALCLFNFSGCSTVGKLWSAGTADVNMSASGQTGIVNDDAIVVRSEQALSIGLDAFNTFLKAEFDNRELFAKIPGAHQTAENIRRNGKRWIKSLEAAHDAYKGNRSAQNHATLITAYKVVQSAIAESKNYVSQASKKGV